MNPRTQPTNEELTNAEQIEASKKAIDEYVRASRVGVKLPHDLVITVRFDWVVPDHPGFDVRGLSASGVVPAEDLIRYSCGTVATEVSCLGDELLSTSRAVKYTPEDSQ